MWPKLSKNCDPKHILVFSLTNIGDVVLTCPVIDVLCENFPEARMDVMIGPKAVSLFEDNPHFKVKIFDKRSSLQEKQAWFLEVRRQHYDCVIDLRRTMLPVFLMPKYATPVAAFHVYHGHKKDGHLNHLRRLYPFEVPAARQYAVVTVTQDERFFDEEVAPFVRTQPFVVVAPGAASSEKRWTPDGFVAVADHLSRSTKVIFVGDAKDRAVITSIQNRMKSPSLSLAGKSSLRQLAYVLKKAALALTHDSGVMHLASYLNVPLVVLWGPTPLEKYAPWSDRSVVVKRNELCERCRDPKMKAPHQCMSFIKPEDVIKAIEALKDEKPIP
ncbi:MAG: glycosyltransferase family 9 protein [Candidatus Omnitrophica bacterium]|nr:glycosyltransferase family 9 protein [Candidatus Omnitrophota bacterium]MDE2222534.1 glycosyltransferase family 9 protein [Candidatus Omnitrophota bacterium]